VYVFVYGTLTDRDRLESVLESSVSIDTTATLEGLHRVDGRYPTLTAGGSVEGRLITVDDDGLAQLDRYEGLEGGFYR